MTCEKKMQISDSKLRIRIAIPDLNIRKNIEVKLYQMHVLALKDINLCNLL